MCRLQIDEDKNKFNTIKGKCNTFQHQILLVTVRVVVAILVAACLYNCSDYQSNFDEFNPKFDFSIDILARFSTFIVK